MCVASFVFCHLILPLICGFDFVFEMQPIILCIFVAQIICSFVQSCLFVCVRACAESSKWACLAGWQGYLSSSLFSLHVHAMLALLSASIQYWNVIMVSGSSITFYQSIYVLNLHPILELIDFSYCACWCTAHFVHFSCCLSLVDHAGFLLPQNPVSSVMIMTAGAMLCSCCKLFCINIFYCSPSLLL